jgi:hypothetical protein
VRRAEADVNVGGFGGVMQGNIYITFTFSTSAESVFRMTRFRRLAVAPMVKFCTFRFRMTSVNHPTIPFRCISKMPTRRPLLHRDHEILGCLSKVDPEFLA